MSDNDKKPKCRLVGTDGNAFAILGRVVKALKDAGQGDKAKEFMSKATNGDYDNLLKTVFDYVNVY